MGRSGTRVEVQDSHACVPFGQGPMSRDEPAPQAVEAIHARIALGGHIQGTLLYG
jgi:hypothetical protein